MSFLYVYLYFLVVTINGKIGFLNMLMKNRNPYNVQPMDFVFLAELFLNFILNSILVCEMYL